MLWPKKSSYKEFDNEKKFLRLENSPPPHNFSNGPSLNTIRNSLDKNVYCADHPIMRFVGLCEGRQDK